MTATATPVAAPDSTRKPAAEDTQYTAIAKAAIAAFDEANGCIHTGFRPTHAKGILLSGSFAPSPEALELTCAPHVECACTPVSVRFSNFGGMPAISDMDPAANPRGFALRFHLAEHKHTDIIGHSIDGFPVRTAEEFIAFLQAAAASETSVAKPSPIETFLADHPAALAFVQTPQPAPFSFASEDYFAVNAYRFINQAGSVRFGRYRIRPEQGAACAYPRDAASHASSYLFSEIQDRLSQGPVRLLISVQIAAPGDVTDDSTVHWPEDRPEIAFGTVELTAVTPNNASEQQHIIFDPIPRVDGIEPSEDPLLAVRAETYLLSGRRRRSGAAH